MQLVCARCRNKCECGQMVIILDTTEWEWKEPLRKWSAQLRDTVRWGWSGLDLESTSQPNVILQWKPWFLAALKYILCFVYNLLCSSLEFHDFFFFLSTEINKRTYEVMERQFSSHEKWFIQFAILCNFHVRAFVFCKSFRIFFVVFIYI